MVDSPEGTAPVTEAKEAPDDSDASVAASPAPDEKAATTTEASAPRRMPTEAPTPGDPPSIADGVERSLDPRSILLQRQIGWLVAAIVSPATLVGALLLVFLVPLSMPIAVPILVGWAAITGGLVFSAHRWPEIEHRHAAYRVDRDGIEIRRGVVWRKVINVSRTRVQHIDVSQGPLERRHGLGTLAVYTAGTEHAKVDLHGLDHHVALRIRDHLLPDEGDDAV